MSIIFAVDGLDCIFVAHDFVTLVMVAVRAAAVAVPPVTVGQFLRTERSDSCSNRPSVAFTLIVWLVCLASPVRLIDTILGSSESCLTHDFVRHWSFYVERIG